MTAAAIHLSSLVGVGLNGGESSHNSLSFLLAVSGAKGLALHIVTMGKKEDDRTAPTRL